MILIFLSIPKAEYLLGIARFWFALSKLSDGKEAQADATSQADVVESNVARNSYSLEQIKKSLIERLYERGSLQMSPSNAAAQAVVVPSNAAPKKVRRRSQTNAAPKKVRRRSQTNAAAQAVVVPSNAAPKKVRRRSQTNAAPGEDTSVEKPPDGDVT
jgi:hypothetical protein